MRNVLVVKGLVGGVLGVMIMFAAEYVGHELDGAAGQLGGFLVALPVIVLVGIWVGKI